MNEKGTTEDITNLPLGKYVVKEEVAPKGYMLDTKEYDVTLSYKDQYEEIITNTTTSLEKVKEMGLHIFKSGIKEKFRSNTRTCRCRIYNKIKFSSRRSI